MTFEDLEYARSNLRLNWTNAALARKRLAAKPPKCAVMAAAKPGSSLESLIAGVLAILGITFQPQVPIGRYVCDFLIGDQLVLEVDGKYFHSKPADRARDKRKDTFLRREGYVVIRLLEEEIKEDPFKCLVKHFPKIQAGYVIETL